MGEAEGLLEVACAAMAQGVLPNVDVSYLADTVLLLRYFEVDAQIRQAISVFKKRTGPHERSLRELRITNRGVQVGEPLRDFRGILTGVPQYGGKTRPLVDEGAADA